MQDTTESSNDCTFDVSLAHVLLVLAECFSHITLRRQLNVRLTTRPTIASEREMYVNDITACTQTTTITDCHYVNVSSLPPISFSTLVDERQKEQQH